MESIRIENFGGIEEMTFEFKSITVLIGPQGSGKSITVKLLYFFKTFVPEMIKAIESEQSKRDFDNNLKEKFINFFPKASWPKGAFQITYFLDGSYISIHRTHNNQLSLDYSKSYKNLLLKGRKIFSEEKQRNALDPKARQYEIRRKSIEKLRECIANDISESSNYTQYFIPAGRSFFANIQKSIFSFLSDNRSLDPFLIEFGSFYENFKHWFHDFISEKFDDKPFDKLVSEILNGTYLREKDNDFLVHSDSRKVNLANASSGQQETLPLMIILKTLNTLNFGSSGATLYIEEPEAHLFPTAQKKIVQLLGRTFNHKEFKFQIIVTTHSPYILSSFNNLIEAGKIVEILPEKSPTVYKIIPKKEVLGSEILVGYSVYNNKNERIIDEESQLISNNILDSVSDEIAIEFGKLLDIEF